MFQWKLRVVCICVKTVSQDVCVVLSTDGAVNQHTNLSHVEMMHVIYFALAVLVCVCF